MCCTVNAVLVVWMCCTVNAVLVVCVRAADRRAKGTEVFVGGLPRSATEGMLREVFSPCGEIVELRIMKDQNGISKGFGFVRFAERECAYIAKRQKNGIEAAARVLRVGSRTDFLLGGIMHPAISWAERESHVDADEMAKIKTAFVGNLPANVNEEYLKRLFEHFGEIVRVAVSRKGQYPVAFIHFGSRSGLDNAIKEMDGKTVGGPERGPAFRIQVSVARPAVENSNKRTREEVKSRRSNVSRGKPDCSHGRYTHDSLDRRVKAPRLSNVVADVTDPYEAAVTSLPSAVKELLLRILRLGIGTQYDIDIHCIKSLNELPESGAVAVLNQFLIAGADKRNKGDYFSSLIAKRKVEAFGVAQMLHDTTYLARNSEIQNKRYRHQDYDYAASGNSRYSSLGDYLSSSYVDHPTVSQSRRYAKERAAVVRWPEPRLRQDEIAHEPRQNTGRHLDRSCIQEQSYNVRSAHEPRQNRHQRYIQEHNYIETSVHEPRQNRHQRYIQEHNYIESSVHEPRQNTGRHLERRYTQEQSYIEKPAEAVLPRERRFLSAAGYNTDIGQGFNSRSSAEYSTEHQQMRFDPFTGEPYKFDPFTGEPIRPESNLRRSGSLY